MAMLVTWHPLLHWITWWMRVALFSEQGTASVVCGQLLTLCRALLGLWRQLVGMWRLLGLWRQPLKLWRRLHGLLDTGLCTLLLIGGLCGQLLVARLYIQLMWLDQ